MNREIENGFKTVNPANNEIIASYQYMNDKEAAEIVERCHYAFESWKLKSLEERGEIIKNIGKGLRDNAESFAGLMTTEMGKLLRHGAQEIELCAGICDYTADAAKDYLSDEERTLPNGGKGIVSYRPLGVIYGIQPWNFPAYQVVRYSIANLMAGNGVLLKHAQNVTGSALMLKQIYEDAGLPKDLFSVLIIDHDQSDRIIENNRVRGVTMTGSASGGKIIAQKAASVLKKTVLELGSNDAYIVMDDADIAMAAKTCVRGRVYNNGETCVAAKRFVVVESVYDEFTKAFISGMEKITHGDPTLKTSKIGPMARKDLREKLHDQVEKSVARGATLALGGKIPDGPGCYYPATVLTNVQSGQPAYDEELFGPVASIIKAKDNADAMNIANDSRFGLGGGIFSKDEKNAIELASKHFDTGMIFINGFGLAQVNMPFGGVKDSGYGREHGGFGMREFVNEKAIMLLG